MQRVVYEGPDCGGKDTLIKALHPDVPCHHQGPYNGNPFDESLAVLHATDHHPLFVFNRFYQGEKIYGPTYRGVSTLGRNLENSLDLAMIRRQTVLVICLPPIEYILEAYRRRLSEEMFTYNVDQIVQVYNGYSHENHYSLLPTLYYDYTAETAADFKVRLERTQHGWYSTRVQ
jgi:hypothetical protein